MNTINAIAKVRFSSARPQRVQIHKGRGFHVELLCMEPGQDIRVDSGEWAYYVITGTAELRGATTTTKLTTGEFFAFAPDEAHTLVATDERRLVCLAMTSTRGSSRK